MLLFALALSLGGAQPPIRETPPLDVPEALREGTSLVADLLSRSPENSVRTNLLRVKPRGGREREISVRFETRSGPDSWVSTYEVLLPSQPGFGDKLVVLNRPGQPNQYVLSRSSGAGEPRQERKLQGDQTMLPFAGSDFWVADLGLEFLHWPRQLLLRKELRKGQSCAVLESVAPSPAETGYSRVVSWIDIDTGGIVHADAYDTKGRLLKLFDPSELQKVDGRMQVKEIEMRNRQTGSRSWVVFDLR